MRTLLSSILLALLAVPALAQPPAETCGAGDSLDGGDTLPINASLAPATDDFTMTGAGCYENSFDHVTCFTPENSCTVDASCTVFMTVVTDGTAPEGLQAGVNVVEGACNTSPASCVDSGSGTGGGGVTGVALTAGTNYCFVCESGITSSLDIQVTAVSGDCGALPVELTEFEIH